MSGIDRELVEAHRRATAQLLAEIARPEPWLDTEGVARLLDVERDWVYANAASLAHDRSATVGDHG